MSKRDYFDYSDLLAQSEEVFGESLRRTFDYDAFAGRRKFPAVVLTPPVPMTARQAGLFTKANRPSTPLTTEELFAGPDAALNKLDKFSFRARIIGPNSPHAFLPDPCQYQASDVSPPDTLFKLMAMHTLFVSSDDYQLGSGQPFPTKGSVVLVELDQNQFGYNLDKGTFINVLSKTNPYYNVEGLAGTSCLAPAGLLNFEGTLGDMGGLPPLKPATAASEFFKKLKASVHFDGFSDQFLIGLTANAQAESAFVSNASGDPLSLYQKMFRQGRVSAKRFERIKTRALGGKCSFGYFQLNVCPQDGGGSELLRLKNINPTSDKMAAIAAINDENNQFEYVAYALRKIFNGREKTISDAFTAADEICVKFERPANKEAKGKQRGNLARTLARQLEGVT